MAAFANEYRAPPGWSVDGLALMAARSAVERAALACARSRLDGDDWVGALDLLSADTLAPYASVELECGAADVAVPPLAPGESHRHSLSLAPLRRGAFGVRARCVVGGRAVAEAEAPLVCEDT